MEREAIQQILSKCHPGDDIKDEFARLDTISQHRLWRGDVSQNIGRKKENRRLNRYSNVLPFDTNRVVIKYPEKMGLSTDYINASWVDINPKKPLIITQGPTNCSIAAFWAMVWEQNISVIVMLTRRFEKGYEKCAQYWPTTILSSMLVGDMVIKLISTQIKYEDCLTCRTFTIHRKNMSDGTEEQRTITQIHYIEWPDFGIPSTTDIMREVMHLSNYHQDETSYKPIIIHCSAGVGRAGTFTTLLLLADKFDKIYADKDYTDKDYVKSAIKWDISETVLQLRTCRIAAIQTVEQFTFLHTTLRDYILCKLST